MSQTELLLIDLSAIAHALYHISGNEPDPNFISTKLIERVRGLASAHPHAAICRDSGKSFRHDLYPQYKANRDTDNRAVIKHQMDAACDTLRADGFPVWAAPNYEADDVIATATAKALEMDPDIRVLIASEDKDLFQLLSDRVSFKSTRSGNVGGPEAVREKWGVEPSQMRDLLALMGDKSDNVKGAERIGQVIGAKLLKEHGSIEGIYAAIDKGVVNGITPAMRTSLQEFRPRWPLVASLIALKTDAPIEMAEIAVERTAKPMEEEPPMSAEEVAEMLPSLYTPEQGQCAEYFRDAQRTVKDSVAQTGERTSAAGAPAVADAAHAREVVGSIPTAVTQQLTRYEPLPPPVADFSLQLEPRTPEEAARLAGHLFKSRLFSAYGTWEGVLSTILAGRELGMPAMASLRAFHVIESKPSPSADLLAALVMKSGKAKYFRCTERTPTRATFVTQRLPVEDYPEQSLTYTIEEARKAWKKDDKAWDNSGWGKVPTAMLVARAKSALARLEYPDVVGGMYAPEELE